MTNQALADRLRDALSEYLRSDTAAERRAAVAELEQLERAAVARLRAGQKQEARLLAAD